MMRYAAILLLTVSVVATPALAQNASQIARVQQGASCPGCNLFQADLGSRELRGLNLSGARLRQADLTAAVMNRVRFDHTDMRDVEASAGVFTGSSFVGANLTNASFVGAYLQGSNFSGANLAGVNFSGAEMDRAVGLSQAQLSGACGDEATTLPRGLRLRRC